jgi:hypothetical protein
MQDETATTEPVKKNKGGRPRKVAATTASGPSFTDDQFQQLIAVLAQKPAAESAGGMDLDALKVILGETAKQTQKAMRPENDTHPGLSALSYPEGDVARPRPVLPFELFWNGYPIHQFPETEHWRELELMAQLQPGEFTVIRKDGTPMAVTVRGEQDANGKVVKLSVEFPISREDKWLVPPKAVVLYQMVVNEGTPKRRFVSAMTEYMTTIMDEPEAVDFIHAVPVGV